MKNVNYALQQCNFIVMKEGIATALIMITYQLLLESIPFCAKCNDHAIIHISD